jgi:hypothetical protein
MLPAAALVAALIPIKGVVVPVATVIGKVPVTELTVPPPPPPDEALVHAEPFQV